MIRGGMEYKHLHSGLEYNLVSKTTVVPFIDNSTISATTYPGYDIKNIYIGLTLGKLVGGARKLFIYFFKRIPCENRVFFYIFL